MNLNSSEVQREVEILEEKMSRIGLERERIFNILHRGHRRYQELNQQQKEAVFDIINPPRGRSQESTYLPVIEGPPGTGKTTVVANATVLYLFLRPFYLNHPRRRKKVVITAYTNAACDRALESLVEEYDFPPTVAKRVAARNYNRYPSTLEDYFICCKGVSSLTPREKNKLKDAFVLLATVDSANKIKGGLTDKTRIVVFVEEASQVNYPLFLQALKVFRACDLDFPVLVGDPFQLQFFSHQESLKNSLMGLLKDPSPTRPEYTYVRRTHELVTQYRMDEEICNLVNRLRESSFGQYPLETADSCSPNLLNMAFPHSPQLPLTGHILSSDSTLVIINTEDLEGREEETPGGGKLNESEARLCSAIYGLLLEASGQPEEISRKMKIITPYLDQKACIRQMISQLGVDGREVVKTVDEMQGKESDGVIISFTRSNDEGYIGFLSQNLRRTYVALSRAKKKLILVMDFETFKRSNDSFRNLLNYAEDRSNNSSRLDLIRINENEYERLVNEYFQAE